MVVWLVYCYFAPSLKSKRDLPTSPPTMRKVRPASTRVVEASEIHLSVFDPFFLTVHVLAV